jgi:hypothetical protein
MRALTLRGSGNCFKRTCYRWKVSDSLGGDDQRREGDGSDYPGAWCHLDLHFSTRGGVQVPMPSLSTVCLSTWDDYRCATASPDAVEWNSPQRKRVLHKLSVVDAGGGRIAKSGSDACQAFDHIASQF